MKKQNGLALVVSLAVLVVAALLGLSSYQASQMEERMAGNHRFSISALQAAEAGVNEMLSAVLAYSYSPGSLFCNDIAASLSGTDFTTPEDGGYSYSDSIAGGDLDLRYKALMVCNSANGHVIGFSRGVVLGGGGEEVSARRVRVEIVPPGYDSIHSMLAEGLINITGQSTVIGNVHSNDSVTISIKETGDPKDRLVSEGSITAFNKVDVGGNVSEGEECVDVVCAAAGVPKQEVPPALDAIIRVQDAFLAQTLVSGDPDAGTAVYEWEPASGSESSITVMDVVDGECVEPESGFDYDGDIDYSSNSDEEVASGDNYVYYCPGNLTTGEDFVGVTVVAEGNITHSGSMTIDDADGSESFVIAGGSITLNGSTNPNNPTPTYASFLSGGDFVQTGNSTIYGAIVSGGQIDIRGGVKFYARDTGKILVPVSGRLEGWMELETPSDEANLTAGEA